MWRGAPGPAGWPWLSLALARAACRRPTGTTAAARGLATHTDGAVQQPVARDTAGQGDAAGDAAAAGFVDRKRHYVLDKTRRFTDKRRVLVRGGKGGLGCVSWFHEPFIRFPRPDGADGGHGGAVTLTASKDLSSLDHLPVTIVGEKGGNAKGNKRLGANAAATVVEVPAGTIVRCGDTVVADLAWHGQEVLVASGGKGGLGNTNGKLRRREYMDREDAAVQGHPGQELRLELELKTIADVGLVGLPNAGKSTFLTAVSNAHPKVAPYPFTTLNPHLGVVDFADLWQMRVADIPGLAVGAHENVGLGHSFLRHVERSSILLLVVDMSGEHGAMSPVAAYRALRHELVAYRPELGQRPCLVAGTKMDRPQAPANFRRFRDEVNTPAVPICALDGRNIRKATARLRAMVEASTPAAAAAAEEEEQQATGHGMRRDGAATGFADRLFAT